MNKKNNIIISVIVPTFKPQDYLWECLNSLCKQSFCNENYEIIVILNGEREPYEKLILKFKESHQDNLIEYFYSKVAGVSNARNIGIETAKGEYLTFVDDDDFVSSSYLEELLQKSSVNTVALSNTYGFDDERNRLPNHLITSEYDRLHKNGKQSLLSAKKFFSGPVYKLIHRDIIGERRYDVRFKNCEDALFMFLISDKIQYVNFTGKEAIYYRRFRAGSATSTKKSTIARIRNCINLIIAFSLIYFRNIKSYNFWFYVTRMLGVLR